MAGLLTLWENYMPWTQAVVVAPLIARARSPFMKKLWYTVLFSTTIAFVVTSFYLFQDYFSYPTTTNIRLISQPQVPFPAVTFCNLNPYKKTMVQHSQELTNLLAAYTYTMKVKLAGMKGGTTVAAKTTTTGAAGSHARIKRQKSPADPAPGECTETQHSHAKGLSSYKYSVWNCPGGAAYVEFRACDANTRLQTNTFSSVDNNNITSFSDCSGTIGINYTHSYNTMCNQDKYITDMASRVTPAIEEWQCVARCKPPPCAFSESEPCTGLYYSDFLCALSTCNVSTASSITSSTTPTTTLATTAETTTTESPSPSTTPEITPTSSDPLATTAAPLGSITELTTTSTVVSTAITGAESTTTNLTTTATEPLTATTVPWISTMATTTLVTATTVDDTSTASTTSRTTTTSEATSTTRVVQTSLALTPETTMTTPLAITSATTEMSTAPQLSTTVNPSSMDKISTTTEKATSQSNASAATSTTVPRTTTPASHDTDATLSVSPTAYAMTSEAQTTQTGTLLTSTSASTAVLSTDSTPTMLQATSTEPAASTASLEPAPSAQGSSSTTTAKTTSTLPMTRGSSTMFPSATVPNEARSLATKVAILDPSASSKAITIHSTRPTGHSSSYADDGSTDFSDGTTTDTTRAAHESTVDTNPETPTQTAWTNGIVSTTPSHSAAPIAEHSTSAPSLPFMETAASSTEARKSKGTTSARGTSLLGSEVTTVGRTTGSEVASGSSTPRLSTLSTDTISAGDGSSHPSNSPSANSLTPISGTGSPYSSTYPVDKDSSTDTTDSGMHSSKILGGSQPTGASNPSKTTATGERNDFTTASHAGSSSSLPNGYGTGPTTGAEGSHRSTTMNPTVKPSTTLTGQVSSSTTRTSIESTSSTRDVNDEQDRTSSPPVTPGSPNDSTMGTSLPTSGAMNDGPYSSSTKHIASTSSAGDVGDENSRTPGRPASPSSPKGSTVVSGMSATPGDVESTSTTTENRGNDATHTREIGPNDHNLPGSTPSTTVANVNSQSAQYTSSAPLATESEIDGGASGTLLPTVTHKGQVELESTAQSGGNDPNSRESTTRSYKDSGNHATTESEGNVLDGDSARAAATTGSPDGSADRTTKKSNEEGDGSNADFTTVQPDASRNELTTTSYEDYLKNIKLDLSSDFDLDDLNEEQMKNLEDLSSAYGLNPSNRQVSVDANMKQALEAIAAKMSPELRQTLGFKLKDLVSSCIMDGEPCDMTNDFMPTFDVDYGNCYTFNHDTPVKYVTKRAGSSRGLRMVIISNTTESLPSTSEQGFKVVVHSQDIAPFPNAEGLVSSVGQLVSLQLSQSKLSKLGAPHGNCSTLESVAKNEQPFYYNGSYTTEGCLRSCFQRNMATACGCADARFPTPTDMNVPFCDPLDPAKYKCREAYIRDVGDYFFVDNCQCYDACDNTAYTAQASQSDWPAGDFFYGPYCPMAEKLNLSCREFYSNNGLTLEVSFASLAYEMKEEEPTTTAWKLANDLAGNSGLWIGYTMLSFVECILVSIQICLWACRCSKELPEVPSCRRRNFWADVDEDSDSDGSSDGEGSTLNRGSHGSRGESTEPSNAFEKACRKRSAVSRWRVAPKNFDNCFGEQALTRREFKAMQSAQLELYGPQQEFE